MEQIDGTSFVYTRYGPPNVIYPAATQFSWPQVDQVLIKVHATSVSSADWRLRSLSMPKGLRWLGRPAVGIFGPRKKVLGTECAGVVIAIGEKVTRFAIGDEVIAFPGASLGAHATHLLIRQSGNIAHKPEAMSFEDAAGLSFAGTTAYDYLLHKGTVRQGDRVLVNGASGAVGLAVLQIAVDRGAKVTAVCSSQNTDLVREYGASDVIPYDKAEIPTHAQSFDVVVDVVGTLGWHKAKKLLRKGGLMLLIAGHAWDMIMGPLIARLAGYRLVSGVAGEDRALFEAVIDLAREGRLKPVIDHVFPFKEMTAAHKRVDSGRKRGAVIVRMVQQK